MELKLQHLFEILEKKNPRFWILVSVILAVLLGFVDYLTGNEIVFSFFYLIPIILVTLAVNQRLGLLMSFLSALIILCAEIAVRESHSSLLLYLLNTAIRTVFYSFVAYLVAALRKTQQEERLAARTDFVTGAVNARYFNELLKMEIDRIRRYPHPFTVVFIDIDNFKTVNDLFGHQMGDHVLRSIAEELTLQLRKTDIVARVGGDEFALLLPSTRQAEAEVVLTKVHANLQEAMKRGNWPVSFSMGVVTCLTPPFAAEQLINLADELMYTVKNTTKNGVRFISWGSDHATRVTAVMSQR